jgi:hypothetical protein
MVEGIECLERWHMAFGGPTSPSISQQISQNAKTSLLKGMPLSFRASFNYKFYFLFVKGQLEEVGLPKLCFTLS